jgi:hypothetical protein
LEQFIVKACVMQSDGKQLIQLGKHGFGNKKESCAKDQPHVQGQSAKAIAFKTLSQKDTVFRTLMAFFLSKSLDNEEGHLIDCFFKWLRNQGWNNYFNIRIHERVGRSMYDIYRECKVALECAAEGEDSKRDSGGATPNLISRIQPMALRQVSRSHRALPLEPCPLRQPMRGERSRA